MNEEQRLKKEISLLQRRQRGFTKLVKVSEVINSIHNIDDLLISAMLIIQDIMGVEASSLLLLEPYTQQLSYKVALGKKSSKLKENFTLKLGQGIAGWVAEKGIPLVVNDAYKDGRFFPGVDEATGFKTKAILCVPLKIKGTVWGALEAINPLDGRFFDDLDKEVFVAFSNQIGIALENAQLHERLRGENVHLRETLRLRGKIVGQSQKMKELLNTIASVAPTDSTILLRGESGTGKELVARSIHESSPRAGNPFIPVACSILSETLLESELFGHEKGAFTGAESQKKGRFELVHNGTVFLDEIGTLSLNTQIKLLRFLQEKEFERVGGIETIKVNVRIIAATNENLEEAIRKSNFREDLYYRLKVIEIILPSLREIKDDIPSLVDYYLNIFCRDMAKPLKKMSSQFLGALLNYSWPGNIRELKNTIERAVVLSKDEALTVHHLPPEILESFAAGSFSMSSSLSNAEEFHIKKILQEVGWNKSKAAKLLKISRNRLERKIKSYNITSSE